METAITVVQHIYNFSNIAETLTCRLKSLLKLFCSFF